MSYLTCTAYTQLSLKASEERFTSQSKTASNLMFLVLFQSFCDNALSKCWLTQSALQVMAESKTDVKCS